MTTREVLTKAADLVDAAPKLAKGVYRVPEGDLDEAGEWYPRSFVQGALCYCAVGAIRKAAGVSAWNTPPVNEAVDQFARSLELEGDSYEEVFFWNDDSDRTKSEVVAALRKAAEQ